MSIKKLITNIFLNGVYLGNQNKVVRVLLIGFGYSGSSIHFPLIMTNPNFKIVGIYRKNKDKFDQNSIKLSDINLYDSIERIMNNLSEFDLAVIATPNSTHKTFANLFLANKKDIVVEKPLAGSENETFEIINNAKTFGKNVFVFQNRRWDSCYLSMQEMLNSKLIGDIHLIESNWENLKTAKQTWRNSAKPEDLGGILLDIGSHLIDQMVQSIGPIENIKAGVKTIRPNAFTDDDIQIDMVHINGKRSRIVASHFKKRQNPRFRITGTKGQIEILDYDNQELLLKTSLSEKEFINPACLNNDIKIKINIDGVNSEIFKNFGLITWSNFYSEVYQTLVFNKKFPITYNQVLYNSRILDLCRKSSFDKCTLNIK